MGGWVLGVYLMWVDVSLLAGVAMPPFVDSAYLKDGLGGNAVFS